MRNGVGKLIARINRKTAFGSSRDLIVTPGRAAQIDAQKNYITLDEFQVSREENLGSSASPSFSQRMENLFLQPIAF